MSEQMDAFIETVRRLRAPGGCPWDREQTHATILSCLLDEAYEFFEAVENNDAAAMREELGDLLLQVVLHAQMARDNNTFTLDDVAAEINEKLIRRHPHVFGDVAVSSTKDVLRNWETIKKEEKEHRKYLTDDIPEALPALFRAEKIQRRVARVGFDWDDMNPVFDKVEEEFREFRDALAKKDTANAEEELGDILFALVNVGRHNNICAEDALRKTVKKFGRRFCYIEDRFKEQGKDITKATLAEMDVLWEESKGVVG